MPGDHLVAADDAEREAEPRAADAPARQIDRGGERQQLPVDHRLVDTGQHHEPARRSHGGLHPGDELADHLGEAESEDHEIDARQAERRQADQRRQDRAHDRRHDQQDGIGKDIDQRRHRVHAEPEERRSGERDVMSRAGEQRPGRGEHGIHDHGHGQRQPVAPAQQRDERGGKEDRRADRQPGLFRPGHVARLPKIPCGRNSRTRMKTT